MRIRMLRLLGLGLVTLALVAGCAPQPSTAEPTLPATQVVVSTIPAPTEAPTGAAPTAAPTEPATAPAPTATPDQPAEPTGSLDGFIEALKLAVAERDFATLESLMADPFTIGYWMSEGVQSSPSEAAELFEANFLPADAQIIWADPDIDLSQMLQGQPPASFLGPDKELAAALLSYGWGPDAGAEAIQFITRRPDGTYAWELMLYSGFGFTGFPTEVKAVVINTDEATFYSGPGEEFAPVATVVGGMPYPVIGVSIDNAWWRLRCYDDNNALIPSCWVSADTAITSPTTLP